MLGGLVVASWLSLWGLRGVSNEGQLALVLILTYILPWGLILLLLRMSTTELAARFLLSTLSLFVIWFVLEMLAVVRLVHYQSLFAAPISEWWYGPPYNVPDQELVYIHRPHLRLVGSQPGDIAAHLCLPSAKYRYDVRYDRHGFRNDGDVTTADIAVIGDSIIEAPTVPDTETVASVLAWLTRATVANLGMSAYGPQQELVVLKRYALPLLPSAVVWAFYEGNDLKDVGRYQQRVATASDPPPRLRSLIESSLSRNVLFSAYRLLTGCRRNPAYPQVRSGVFRDATGRSVTMYFAALSEPLSPKDKDHLAVVGRVLAEAHALTQPASVDLVVLFVPTSFRVYKDIVACAEGSNCGDWSVNDLPQRLGNMVTEISPDIRYIDLTTVFADAAQRGTLVYRPDDTHWTPDGHRIAAEAIARAVSLRRRRD